MSLLLAIDQGTTSSRAIVFTKAGEINATAQEEFAQIYPNDGWVEHDPEAIWDTTLRTCREVVLEADGTIEDIAAIGITNQRETTVVWDRATGEPVYNAIVWQDRRTAARCVELKDAGKEALVVDKTGLLLDPYFSGTKVAWILDNVPGARDKANRGELAFGTIDTFLLWRLTEGAVHATDATNASRTMLFNIHTQQWDDELLALLGVPASMLPEVKDSADDYGHSAESVLGHALPIRAMIGDQQAASVGQACFEPGMVKSTYGTGCFMLLNTGKEAVTSNNRLLTTVAYRLNGETTYALEGSIFVAGAAVQWMRDAVKLVGHAAETEGLAESVDDNGGVYLVPAFTGLGAPYWDPDARGAIFGLTRDSGLAHIVRAGLEAQAYQTRDLLLAMAGDGAKTTTLRVDGGMVVNNWVVQFLSDILDLDVDRPVVTETTALGAAYLAGLSVGVYDSIDEISSAWALERRFSPAMADADRDRLYSGWLNAVTRTRTSS